MEHILRFANDHHRLGFRLRPVYLHLLVSGITELVGKQLDGIILLLGDLDVLVQQDGQALGSLFPLPG